MANMQNLVQNSGRSREEVRAINRKGGIRSGKTRAFAKTFKEKINEVLTDDDLKDIINTLVKEAKKGNIKAIEMLRDTRGEKPVEKQEVKQVATDWFIDEDDGKET